MAWSPRACLLLAAVGGLVVGLVTSFGQSLLPDGVASLANSAGAWSTAAFLLALPNRRPRLGIVLGPLAFVAMLAGYDVATVLRGFSVSTSSVVFWGLAAVVAGPVLGVGAAWARGESPRLVGLGVAPLAGILLGEAAYGMTVVAGSTDSRYWVGQALVGLVAIACVGVRTRSATATALCALIAAAIAVAFVAVYSGDLLALAPLG